MSSTTPRRERARNYRGRRSRDILAANQRGPTKTDSVQQPVPFGKYILLERISVGGMAEVFKAKSFGVKGFAKIIAIKRILPQLAEDEHFVAMFIGEAKMAVQLSHANICQIFDLGRIGDDHYIAMEFISGKDLLSLHNYFRRTHTLLPVPLAAYIGARVAEGLDYAHRKRGADGEPMGIVHRDVSPQNVIVSYDGDVKLIDFGVAKARVRNYQETQAGVLKGKFGYMSPEQIEGLEVDHRSDLFALGTVIHEVLTSRRCFLGETDFNTLEKIREASVDPPSLLNPEVPPELDRIILKALARNPDDRYAHGSELAYDLARFLHVSGVPYSGKVLGEWMREHFADDIAKEKARHEIYAQIDGYPRPEASPFGLLEDDDEDEEETALWDGPAPDPAAEARAEKQARPTWLQPEDEQDPALPLVRTRVTDEGQLPPDSLPSRPTPVPHRPPSIDGFGPMPGVGRRGGRRDVLIAGTLVFLAVAGGVIAYRAVEPARREAGSCSLVLRVDPPDALNIYLDDKRVGDRSPVVLRELLPAPYSIRVGRPGYRIWRDTVTLAPDELRELQITLEPRTGAPQSLRFEVTPPDARISVNGEPLTAGQRRAGFPLGELPSLRLSVRRDGYAPHDETIAIQAGTPDVHHVNLRPTPGTLVVDADPPGAVYLDGRRIGRTPQSVDDLDAGRAWRVRVVRDGYLPFDELVEFGDKRYVEIDARLKRDR